MPEIHAFDLVGEGTTQPFHLTQSELRELRLGLVCPKRGLIGFITIGELIFQVGNAMQISAPKMKS